MNDYAKHPAAERLSKQIIAVIKAEGDKGTSLNEMMLALAWACAYAIGTRPQDMADEVIEWFVRQLNHTLAESRQ